MMHQMAIFLLETGKDQYSKEHKFEGTRCLADFSIQMHESGRVFDRKGYCNFFLRILTDSNDIGRNTKPTSKLFEDMQVQAIRALGRLGEWKEHARILLDSLEASNHSARRKWNILTALQSLLSSCLSIQGVGESVQFDRLLRFCREGFEGEENWKVRIAMLRLVPDFKQIMTKWKVDTRLMDDSLLSLLAFASKVEVPLEHQQDYLVSLNLALSNQGT
jgi:hypothetical protein